MKELYKFQEIIRTAVLASNQDANKYLDAGWVLLMMESHQYSQHGWSANFILGWPKSKGEPVIPEVKSFRSIAINSDHDMPF